MNSPNTPLKEIRPEEAEATPAPAAAAQNGAKRRRFLQVGGLVLVVGVLALVGNAILTRGQVTTDDAQVEADVVPVSPRVSGQVLRVLASSDQVVKKGDVIAEIDGADYAARMKQAEAELDTARAQAAAAGAQVQVVDASAHGGYTSAQASVLSSGAAVLGSDAQIASAQAGLLRAEAEARKAAADLQRSKELRAGDAISPEQLERVQTLSDTAQAGVAQAKAQLAAAQEAKRTALGRVSEAEGKLHQSTPIQAQITTARANADLALARVKSAEAMLELARLQLSYTRILAPGDGQVSKLTIREGQMLVAGQAVAELVPLQSYVIANFKETQIGDMKEGQRAEVEVDAFPGRKFEGKVESLSGGTGARFSLLPPDNASGNYVKVVERIPVRVRWVKQPEVPVRAGFSATVTVHTRG
jgi:membrane fusion protein (multidrug efflux system)